MDQFQPRRAYVAASWMLPVGRYSGKDKEKLSFLELAERVGEIFSSSPVRRQDIDTASSSGATAFEDAYLHDPFNGFGPINNNVVILLEDTAHFDRRRHERYKPAGLPPLGRIKMMRSPV